MFLRINFSLQSLPVVNRHPAVACKHTNLATFWRYWKASARFYVHLLGYFSFPSRSCFCWLRLRYILSYWLPKSEVRRLLRPNLEGQNGKVSSETRCSHNEVGWGRFVFEGESLEDGAIFCVHHVRGAILTWGKRAWVVQTDVHRRNWFVSHLHFKQFFVRLEVRSEAENSEMSIFATRDEHFVVITQTDLFNTCIFLRKVSDPRL